MDVLRLMAFLFISASFFINVVTGEEFTSAECYYGDKEGPKREPDLDAYLFNEDYEDKPIIPWDGITIPDCDVLRFVLHGWRQNRFSMMPIIKAYQEKNDTSVIAFDWEHIANKDFKEAQNKMYRVVNEIMKVLEKVRNETKKEPSKFHMVGFGVGAHILGLVGRWMNGTIGEIIGLDPTVTGYDEDSEKDRSKMLNKDSAKFVRIIHTDGFRYGITKPMGHADYYINGGYKQPGCPEEVKVCSHLRAIDYMAEAVSIDRTHVNFRCASWYDLWYNGECRVVPSRHALYVSRNESKCPEDHYDLELTEEILDKIELPTCDYVRIVVHGYLQNRFDWFPFINEYRAALPNSSIISIDWTIYIKQYKFTFMHIKDIAHSIFYLIPSIEKISKKNVSDYHFLGFGMGAQILGQMARRMNPGSIGVIVGLDPISSGFDEYLKADRALMLGPECAKHVRIIHTNAAHYGIRKAMGHMDFYLNGGFLQPGCPDDRKDKCSHLRAMDYITEVVRGAEKCIKAYHCASIYDLYYNHECRIIPKMQSIYDVLLQPDSIKLEDRGIYFASTNILQPYTYSPSPILYVATDVVHVSHTNQVYGSDYGIRLPCVVDEVMSRSRVSYQKKKHKYYSASYPYQSRRIQKRNAIYLAHVPKYLFDKSKCIKLI